MRTTVDIPEHVHRLLEERAKRGGHSVQELVVRLLQLGLRDIPEPSPEMRSRPPAAVPRTGGRIPPCSRGDIARIEEEDEAL